MKRPITSALLAAALSLSLVVPAGAVSSSTAVEAIQALGIITGDSSGDLNLSSPVTRAEFVTMMTAASSYKDSIGEGSGVSLFKDVKSDHWAREYIKLAVEQGWMSGYVDGTFRPDDQITLEEACTALLKMLGYDSSTLAGSYPSAQLSKASSVGLRDDVDAVQGEALTRQDCVMLFYNLLVSDDSSGTVYGTTLGYTVTNGEVDYSTLVTADTKGPYVASANKSLSLPFSTSGATCGTWRARRRPRRSRPGCWRPCGTSRRPTTEKRWRCSPMAAPSACCWRPCRASRWRNWGRRPPAVTPPSLCCGRRGRGSRWSGGTTRAI